MATYDYHAEDGEYLFSVRRYAFPKDFRQGQRQGSQGWKWGAKDVRRVLYRLPEVVAGVATNRHILIVEGEKDADELFRHEFVATTCPGGAGKWRGEYSPSLKDAKVCILPDNDDQGREHGQAVARALQDVAAEVRVLELPDLPKKGDVSDWFAAGGTDRELRKLVTDAPVWEPLSDNDAMSPDRAHGDKDEGKEDAPHLTDLGNAERLVQLHGDRIRHVYAWKRWPIWDDRRWLMDEGDRIQRLAKGTVKAMHTEAVKVSDRDKAQKLSVWAFKSEAEARLQAMISLARSEEDVPVVPADLDADPMAFNVLNGTIDLKTGKLRKHNPKDLITKLAPVEYEPTATAERFELFMLEIMNKRPDLVSFLKRCVGYSMTGNTTEHVLLFLHGLGANGKTTLLNVLLRLFGDYGKQSEPELLLRKRGDAHPTGVADLKGARFVATSEIDAGRHLAESLVKQLTGGDQIKARFMKQDFFEFTPTHTLWLAANHKPVIKGVDTAIWRRIRLVPFDVSIPPKNQDPDLAKKLNAELSGILNWAVEGCLEWQAEGLSAPDEVRTATAGYREDMDVLAEFIAEHCTLGDNEETEARDLYSRYSDWTEKTGERKLWKNQFGIKLQERGFEKRKHQKHRRIVYRGIGLGNPSEATRSNEDVNRLRSPRVESNVSLASGTFADVKDSDYERDERDGMVRA